MTAPEPDRSALATQAALVRALCDSGFPGREGKRTLIETHISYVVLTGTFAYKIKKAVRLGFLDFRSLAARHFYCDEELRLNRRLAPKIYLDVVPIAGTATAPVVCDAEGPAIEYAVRMREFPQAALASRMLARGEVDAAQIDALAATVARFHASCSVAGPGGPFGGAEGVLLTALQNFTEMTPLASETSRAALDGLKASTIDLHATCGAAMSQRREQGFVRECHGDLHLNNIALVDNELVIFDCIEFNEQMRWIDVMSEIAFTAMDLRDRGRPDFGHRFVNAYLEITGDYEGLSVLRFYLLYRAMVRAKIALMRAQQLGDVARKEDALVEYHGYLDLAAHYAEPPTPGIIITHGLAGSGKTTLSQPLLETVGAVRIRTDVERKRLHGLAAAERDRTGLDEGVYAAESTSETYTRALYLARIAASAGFRVIIDGAFLKRWQRSMFEDLAVELEVPFVIVTFIAPEPILRERIAKRLRDVNEASDADLAVLEHQLRTQEPLGADELVHSIHCDAQAAIADATQPAHWRAVLDRLSAAP